MALKGSIVSITRSSFLNLFIPLVREILHLSGKGRGKVKEFQKPLAVATKCMLTLHTSGTLL